MAALGHDRCTVCKTDTRTVTRTNGKGCVTCRPKEMAGTWGMFSDQAIIELLADACAELGRRDVPLKVTA